MKRVNNIYNSICDIDVIMDMYDKVVKVNTKNKRKLERFDNFYSCNIKEIKEDLMNKNYQTGGYNIFLIREPKLRIIMSRDIKDKIVNHLVAKYFLIPVFDKCLIDSNCATRIGRGTHYGLRLFKKYLNIYKNKYDKFYILKFDISKYFYNIDHEIVKDLVKKKIKDKDCLKIINSIIDSTDCEYINNRINNLKSNEINRLKSSSIFDLDKRIDEVSKLPLYNKGKGLPIDNMSSQVIIWMN